MSVGLLIVFIFTMLFSMVARRLQQTVITAPMVFLGVGYLLSFSGLLPEHEAVHLLHYAAEITLVVLLFLDAAKIDIVLLRKQHVWPTRMLLIGLPLTMALGTLFAMPFLAGWSLIGVALLAAILAPTDAALGQAVVTNPIVPERVRLSLTVESGLNDGLALPLILLFTSLAGLASDSSATNWYVFGSKQLVLGPLVGVATGVVGAWILLYAQKHRLTSDTFEGVGALCLAGAAYLAATLVGGNGFISAFSAGLGFGLVAKGRCKFVYEFMESEGQLLTWGTFFLLGLALLPHAIDHLTLRYALLILTSLLVVRPLAIWISLVGTDASPMTRGFFGWFGPRGLATALFALLVIPRVGAELAEPIQIIAINAVWMSALLHGLSAVPAAKWYSKRVRAKGTCAETQAIPEVLGSPSSDPAVDVVAD